MGYQSNVVLIYRNEEFHSAKITEVADGCRDIAVGHLRKSLHSMFGYIDDVLVDLGDNTQSLDDRSAYYGYIRQIRLQQEPIEVGFIEQFNRLFDVALMQALDSAPGSPVGAMVIDGFLFMEDDEIENSIAMTHIIAKAQNCYSDKLQVLQQKFDILVQGIGVCMHNPVDPAHIGESFKLAAAVLDADIKVKTRIHKYFDVCVMQNLEKMYDSIIAFLIKSEI